MQKTFENNEQKQTSLILVKNKKKSNIIKNILKGFVIVLFPIVLFLAIELLNGMSTEVLGTIKHFFRTESIRLFLKGMRSYISIVYTYYFGRKWINIVLITGLLAGIYGLTGKLRKSMIITTVITMTLAIVNYLLLQIRGTAITPADFYSVLMVTKMAGGIEITLSLLIFVSIGLIALWIILCSKMKFKEIDQKKKKIIRSISMICCIAIFVIFFATDLLYIRITYNTKRFYEKNGVCASFLTILKEMKFEKPEGYSIDAIEKGLKNSNYSSGNLIEDDKKETPNIIVIMNESLSDLSSLYGLDITEDNMPFLHSMKENTIKANLHTSALGGKTANCEWEFLTGNSTKFLPVGSVVYEQYLKKETYSIVELMNSKGYKTSAFHPYNPQGYNRMLIYPLLGFNEYKFNDTMDNLNLIRYNDYADDLSTYKNIINLFENKNENEKIFNFTITMQNHSSYKDTSFENTVFLSDYDKEEYFEINQYLSLIKLSDEAFEYLINYFEDFDEPTLIMMFGDHQPAFVDNYPEIFGATAEDGYVQNQYIVPMVMWANYDIEEYNIEDISMNYLSTLLFETAGLQKNEYMEYLSELYKKYPVITANTYKNDKGDFYEYETVPEEFTLYEYIQYNNMFDDEKLNYLFENKSEK